MELLSLDNKYFISTNTTYVTDLNKNKISIEKQENGNFKIFYNEKTTASHGKRNSRCN